MWIASQDRYLWPLLVPAQAATFAGAYMEMNVTYWDCPFPYLSAAGHFHFAIMCMVQVTILAVSLIGLRLLQKSGNIVSSSAFILVWEWIISTGFRVFR